MIVYGLILPFELALGRREMNLSPLRYWSGVANLSSFSIHERRQPFSMGQEKRKL